MQIAELCHYVTNSFSQFCSFSDIFPKTLQKQNKDERCQISVDASKNEHGWSRFLCRAHVDLLFLQFLKQLSLYFNSLAFIYDTVQGKY